MAGDDDTMTPDPLVFKNVPRRPRSAGASWPRNEEPDGGGGDPGGGISSVSNNASPPAAMRSVASNKRPASSTGGGAAEHGRPRPKKHREQLVPVEEDWEPKDANKDCGVGMLPALFISRKDKAAAAAAAAAAWSASSSEAEPDVDWVENERRSRKRKTPVVNEDDDASFAAVARRRRPAGSGGHGNGKLLMGDAIRSHESAAVAGSFEPGPSRTMKAEKPPTKPKKPRNRTKPKKKEKARNKDSSAPFWCGLGTDGRSSAGSDADWSFDRIGVVSDRLRTTLRGLGVAAAPVRLYGRLLTMCDRLTAQARLLMSCKRWIAEGVEFPICAFLTEEEKKAAYGGKGLLLTAYDRGGDAYELKFRFLGSNDGCRLINKWTDFLRHNGLLVGAADKAEAENDDVMIDLWLFRTPPTGKVGMVMLHYRRGDAPHADAALDVVEQKRLRRMLNNNAAAAAVMVEDAVGDANNEEGVEDAGVMVEVAAAAPAPSSPSSEPSGGGGGAIEAAATSSSPSEPEAANAAEEQAGALMGEVTDDAPSMTSSELRGGSAGRSDEVTTAPLLSLGSGYGTEEKRAEGGGALMVMMVGEAATQSAIEVAGPPSSPEQAGVGAAMMATTEDEDEAAADLVEAAARSWNVTKYEFEAAQGLLMLSEADSDS